MKIADSITQLIGHTPLLRLNNYFTHVGLHQGEIIAKLEYFNPAGSVKDRVALAMVEAAGLRNDATIIEPTSGNTGIGLAMVAASRGLKLILTMPESMSIERRQLLSAFGAQIVLTPACEGMQGAVNRAIELQHEIAGGVMLGQFDNPANPMSHTCTTAREIIEDTDGDFDLFVACVGTGGTISGTGRMLKEYRSSIEIVAVEPAESPLLSGGIAGTHRIQGIGANFIPANYDSTVVDRVIQVTSDDAFAASRLLARSEGFLVGISSGAAIVAATQIARNEGKRVVVLLPDTGERYLSTELFASAD